MFAPVKTGLLTLALAFTAQAIAASDLPANFNDAMALEMGMTPLKEYKAAKKNVSRPPTAETLARLQQENRLLIVVDKSKEGTRASSQTLVAYEYGIEVFRTMVSTGTETMSPVTPSGRRYVRTTPAGHFRPTRVYTKYLSHTWNSPMDNAVFIIGGIALHATPRDAAHQGRLGFRASGGCVRLKIEDSLRVRELVMNSGKGFAEGNYVVTNPERGRLLVTRNTVEVAPIVRASGEMVSTVAKVQGWDTTVLVHE